MVSAEGRKSTVPLLSPRGSSVNLDLLGCATASTPFMRLLATVALCILAGTAHAQESFGAAKPLDLSEALSREVVFETNSGPESPECLGFSGVTTLAIKAQRGSVAKIASEDISVNGEPCSSGASFTFLRELRPRTGLNPNTVVGYEIAVQFLAGGFVAVPTGNSEADRPDNLRVAVAEVKSGTEVPVCAGKQLRGFFIVEPTEPFSIPQSSVGRRGDGDIPLSPGTLYMVANFFRKAEGGDDDFIPDVEDSADLRVRLRVCSFGETARSQKGDSIETEDTAKTSDDTDDDSSNRAAIIGIAAGVVGIVLGVVIITIAALVWRRRVSTRASEGRCSDGCGTSTHDGET